MTNAVEYQLIDDVAVLRANNPPVNALGQAVRAGLLAGVLRAEGEAKAILIIGKDRFLDTHLFKGGFNYQIDFA